MKKSDIEEFYRFVDNLGLRFPNAEISRVTGYSKGNVSSYLNKSNVPSEKFIKAVYAAFKKSSINVPHENKEKAPDTDSWLQRLDKLIESNERLSKANESLTQINQEIVAAHLKMLEKINSGETGKASPPYRKKKQARKNLEQRKGFGDKGEKNLTPHPATADNAGDSGN